MVAGMDDRESTVRSRELGEALRKAMVKAGITGQQAAVQLGWSTSRVSRILTGKRGGKPVEVASLLTLCRVIGAERERLMRLAEEVHVRGWLQHHGSRLPKTLQTLIEHEDRATRISEFQVVYVPGLLQTREYARAVVSACVNVPEEEVEGRVVARLTRQGIFNRENPIPFAFLVHEYALRLPVGGEEIMSEQLHHLLRMSVRPHITLRVIPAEVGAHAGMTGDFRIMEFPDHRPVVYMENETSSLFLEEREEISAYQAIYKRLRRTSLDEGESRELIERVADEL